MTAMATILTTVVSIAALTALAWAARKLLRAPLCPICTGVAGTWLWMVVARQIGVELDGTMLSVLLGGSAVGLSYQLEKHLPPGRSVLLWKSLFFPAALVAAYGIASPAWLVLAAAAGVLLVLTFAFLVPPRARTTDGAAVSKLEDQMKNCC